MDQPTAPYIAGEAEGFSEELRAYWKALPNKTFFFALLVAWLALFQFLGNSTLGYVPTPSLFGWMYNAYNTKTTTGDDSHGNVIPLVVLVLLWWKRKELMSQPLRLWWPGLLLVAMALLLHIFGFVVQQQRLSIVALFAGIYGLMGMTWGPGWLRKSFFPFFLFAFCVPLGSQTEPLTFPLRLLVTKIVAFVGQNLLAIDVIAQGTRLLKMPFQYEYDVAPACSGIRSLIAITAIALIYAFLAFRSNWKRLLLIASALPLAVIGNTFRMLVIVIAAEIGGQQLGLKAHDSAIWSMLPYVPAIIGLMLLGRWLEGPDTRKHPSDRPAQEQPTPS